MEELDVARVVLVIELVMAGVTENQRPALSQHRLAPIEVVEVSQRHHLQQDGVEDRVYVVG